MHTLQPLQHGFPPVQSGGVWEDDGDVKVRLDLEQGLYSLIVEQAGDGETEKPSREKENCGS